MEAETRSSGDGRRLERAEREQRIQERLREKRLQEEMEAVTRVEDMEEEMKNVVLQQQQKPVEADTRWGREEEEQDEGLKPHEEEKQHEGEGLNGEDELHEGEGPHEGEEAVTRTDEAQVWKMLLLDNDIHIVVMIFILL